MSESVRIPHQALMEFVAVVTRVHRGAQPLLSHADAWREAEELLTQFTVLYPNAVVFRTALRGAAAYQLSWLMPICGLTLNTMVSTKLSPRISKMADFTVAFGLEIPF